MNPIKPENTNVIPLEEIRGKLHKIYGKKVTGRKINEVREELINKILSNLGNNIILKPE